MGATNSKTQYLSPLRHLQQYTGCCYVDYVSNMYEDQVAEKFTERRVSDRKWNSCSFAATSVSRSEGPLNHLQTDKDELEKLDSPMRGKF